jgi:hypothetical protein
MARERTANALERTGRLLGPPGFERDRAVGDSRTCGTAAAKRIGSNRGGHMMSRTSYEAKAAKRFARVQSQLTALGVEARKAVAGGQQLLIAAQSKHDQALHRYELLKLAGEESWSSVRITFEAAWKDLRNALERKE